MRLTYAVALWDPEASDVRGGFSTALAREFLGGRHDGYTLREIGRILRTLRRRGWDDIHTFVWRSDHGHADGFASLAG